MRLWLHLVHSRARIKGARNPPSPWPLRGSQRRILQEIRVTNYQSQPPPPALPSQAHPLCIPNPRRKPELETMVSPSGLPRGGGALGPEWDGGGAEVRTHAPGRRLEKGRGSRENEPFQSWEGRGKDVAWCLTRGADGGQGWVLLILVSPPLPLQQGLAGEPRREDV